MKSTMLITGGLGNQMFEYALVLALRNREHHVKIDTSYYDFFQMHNGYELERVFGIKEALISKQGFHMYWLRLLHKIQPNCLYKIDELRYDEYVLKKPQRFLFGYWQDERYFSCYEDEIRKTFTFLDIDENNISIAEEMRDQNSVSLHIRRGDYSEFGMTLMGDDYYRKSIEHIKNTVEKPYFYIFSDNADVAKEIVDKMDINYTLMSHNRGKDSYKDMYLMSHCKHNILANSSFSWWGAWLNNNQDKIIVAPQVWDAQKLDFHPQCDSWILL